MQEQSKELKMVHYYGEFLKLLFAHLTNLTDLNLVFALRAFGGTSNLFRTEIVLLELFESKVCVRDVAKQHK